MLKFTKTSPSTYTSVCEVFEIVNNSKMDNDLTGWDLYSTFDGCTEFEASATTKKELVERANYINS